MQCIRALRLVAEYSGAPPNRDTYERHAKHQRALGAKLPSAEEVTRECGSWPKSLAMAFPPKVLMENWPALPDPPAKVRQYGKARLVECLSA